MIANKKNEAWCIDDDGNYLWAWGIIDPEFDGMDYHTAPTPTDECYRSARKQPNVVGRSYDKCDISTPCEEKYKEGLSTTAHNDMKRYRSGRRCDMR